MSQKCQVSFGGDIVFEIVTIQKYANFIKWQVADGNKSALQFLSAFIDADHPNLTLDQKPGWLDDANQKYLLASP